MHEQRAARDLIDGCEQLATTTLHPTDGEHLCEKPAVGIRVTGFSSQSVTLCGRGFGVVIRPARINSMVSIAATT